jgi:hypothetical protein
MKRIMTTYVSELDQFLMKLDETCVPTKAQEKEIQKAARLSALRDGGVKKSDEKSSLWEGF